MPKNVGIWRVRLLGSQMPTARPIRKSIRPMVTTSCATSGAPASRRIRMRSISAPRIGAATSTVIANGDERLHAVVDLQLPVDEGAEHPHRALREVEDARRRVGDDQTHREDRVDRPDRDPDDEGEQDRVPRDRPAGPRLLEDEAQQEDDDATLRGMSDAVPVRRSAPTPRSRPRFFPRSVDGSPRPARSAGYRRRPSAL